eukprot:31083-Pelagococcus_subviridis.AAC.14
MPAMNMEITENAHKAQMITARFSFVSNHVAAVAQNSEKLPMTTAFERCDVRSETRRARDEGRGAARRRLDAGQKSRANVSESVQFCACPGIRLSDSQGRSIQKKFTGQLKGDAIKC